MSKRQFLTSIFIATIFGGLVVLIGVKVMLGETLQPETSISEQQHLQLTNYNENSEDYIVPEGLNFISAAEQVTPGVVHIRSIYSSSSTQSNNPFDNLLRPYGGGMEPSHSSGSGVIISDKGYIVTNNHVVDEASKVEVVLDDNRSFNARIVGTDPQTDLALLKIDATNLPFVKYGNSDNVKIGEWVLAVGNPFNLTSTVTAGIVSAKARNIGILRSSTGLQIESFIQTDAAVNPGNSGGALINLKGELIGINTAIASQTGSYSGYSFAVPVTLVEKVMNDLLEFGKVQRGLLGIMIGDVNAQLAEQENLDVVKGVFVSKVNDNSAADEAGIKSGDVIIGINDVKVDNVAELQEIVARNRPGDVVEVIFLRNGKENRVTAVLKNNEGNTELVKREENTSIEGATFENVSYAELEKLNIEGGVKITKIRDGKWKDAGVKEGFIITSVDKTKIQNVEELNRLMENKQGGVLVEGFYEDGEQVYYGLGW
ncbi:MAG: Do family serine endopeptidase [Cyclobacteriaceae bacterium]|nr:Do family serine endopeptidase [Cyclobacteriaceae bacterium]